MGLVLAQAASARARRCAWGSSRGASVPAVQPSTRQVIRQLRALYRSVLSVFRCKPSLPKLKTHGKL